MWACRCECGSEVIKRAKSLLRGRLLSCGCLKSPHGHNKRGKRTRTYRAWVNMISRCTRPYVSCYADYGGRGITFCERWRAFDNFLADMGECPPGKSLERRANNGNYEPANCYWATSTEQANNKRRTAFATYCGERVPIAILAARHGMSGAVLYERIVRYNWPVDRAITTPVAVRKSRRH